MDLNLSIKRYSKYKTWNEFFPDGKVKLSQIVHHSSWDDMFEQLFKNPKCENTEKVLSDELKVDKNVLIHPAPELVFNAFLLTPLNKVKVVIIGQDPYFDHEEYNDILVHQAMGLSFSVPHGVKIPSSLDNIYKNMITNGQIKTRPTHGNLEFLALQGVLWLNSSLTVKDGKDNKNCHQKCWTWFTDEIIRYISANTKGVVFVLWGQDAIGKMSLIDVEEPDHEIIASSHPSGLSCAKPSGSYPPFNNVDQFGKINKYVEKHKRQEIVWQL